MPSRACSRVPAVNAGPKHYFTHLPDNLPCLFESGLLLMSNDKPAFFISDAHLGIECPGYDARGRNLAAFLQELRGRAGSLFIVGDLFDFWVEYAHAIRPVYFNVLHHLRNLIETGTVVHYLAGNHDFALGPFLRNTIGMHTYFDHLELVLQGKKLHLHHGDGLIAGEAGYRVLRSFLRNPVLQACYKLMHPNIGVPLAKFFSGSSRHLFTRRCSEDKLAAYRNEARKLLSRGSDIVIFGHSHHAELLRLDGAIYCNTGEWIRRYTYAKLEEGELTLWEYFSDKPTQPFVGSSGEK
ncbi:MAG: hypothetical protein GF418_06045 [Chitinivibrionales bacterium]|nr:hypothetical protein [Chitinivibrionales bacterium]MBD3395173.1 hypothetical protein [Chitinivibrionales bacterium]